MNTRKDHNKFDSVIVSKSDHLYTLSLAITSLNRYTNVDKIYIVTHEDNFLKINKLASNIILINENNVIPSMTLDDLKSFLFEGFPEAAGWYFQQFLKLGCAFIDEISERYLVWDADTVLLRPLDFYDGENMIYTIDKLYHAPYFHNYKRLIGLEANREYSFIAQHMPMYKYIVMEMLNRIENKFPGSQIWAWELANTPGCGCSVP